MRIFLIVFAFLVFPAAARAEVSAAGPSAFLVTAEAPVNASPDAAWRALVRIQRWWGAQHTYSGESRRLSLDPVAGGCWCERWARGSVEHGRVVAVHNLDGVRTLRVDGAFGPLQQMGAHGVLTFTLRPAASGATVALTYRVSGEPGLNLEAIAAPVDAVMTEQFGRLVRFIDEGTPD